MRRLRFSLGTRLVLTLLLFAVLPLGAGAFLTLREQERALRSEALGSARQVAQLVASRVDLMARDLREDLSVLADTRELRAAVLRKDWAAAQRVLDITARHHPDLRAVVLADGAGTARAATGVAWGLLGENVSARPHFALARARRALAVSEPFRSPLDQQPVFGVAVPIVEKGRIVAILGAAVDLHLLVAELQRVKLGATGFVVVQTAEGRILAHPDSSRLLQLAPEATRAATLTRQGASGVLETLRQDGTRDLTGFASVPAVGWVALAHLPEREALTGLTALRRRVLAAIGVLALIVLGAALMHGRALARPLRELGAAARAMGAGDLAPRVAIRRADEVGEVGRAFNEMADRRQRAEAALQNSIVLRDALARLSTDIAAGTDRASIVSRVVAATAQLLGAPYAALWRVDPEQGRLVPAAEYADPDFGTIPPQPPIPLARSFLAQGLRGGDPVAVPDVRHDPRWGNPSWRGLEHLGAYVGVPLAKEGAAVGALVAMDRPGRIFTEEEAELLRSLGTHAVLGIDRAVFLDDARRAAAQAQALVEVGKLITGTLNLDSVLDLIVDKVLMVTGADACAISRITPAGDLEHLRARGFSGPTPPTSFPRGEGLMGHCLEVGALVWSRDLLADSGITYDPQTRAHVQAEGMHAGLAVPIVTSEGPYGVLFIGRRHAHDHTADEIDFAEVLAAQTAIAIQNARLYEQARKRADEIAVLHETSQAITGSLDLESTLRRIAESGRHLAGADRAFVWLVNPQDQSLRAGIALGPGAEAFLGTRVPAESPATAARAAREGHPIAVPDALDPASADAALSARFGNAALLAIPLAVREAVLGVLVVGYDRPRTFAAAEVDQLVGLGRQAALAIENARLFTREQERRSQVEAVRAVTAEILRELDLTTLLDLIHRRAAELVGAGSGVVYLWHEEEQVLTPQAWFGLGDWVRGVRFRLGERLVGAVAQRREGLLLNDYRYTLYAGALFLERTAITAAIAEPLLFRDRLLGVIVVNNQGTKQRFTEQDREVLALFAGQAAIAIENARLYQASQQSAREALALATVSRELARTLDVSQAASRIVGAVLGLLSTRAALLFQIEPGDALTCVATAGVADPGRWIGQVLPPGACIGGPAIVERRPAWSPDVTTEAGLDLPEWFRERVEAEGIPAVASVPLIAGEEIVGVLTVADAAGRAYTEENLRLLAALAGQAALAFRNASLYGAAEAARQAAQDALSRVKQLQGLLPICSYCKKVRDDKNYWQRVETYIAEHSEVQFSHGICPECYEKCAKPELEKVRRAWQRPPEK